MAFHCGHDATKPGGRICIHLAEILLKKMSSNDDLDFEDFRWFDGKSKEYALVCGRECAAISQGQALMVTVCPDCFRRMESGWQCIGVIGQMIVPERNTGMTFNHEKISLADLPPDPIVDIQPVNSQSKNVWLAVTTHGKLILLDLDNRICKPIVDLPANIWSEMDEPHEIISYSKDTPGGKREQRVIHLDVQLQIHVSNNGRLAAVVNNRGKYGVVIEIEAGKTLMVLDRGYTKYHATDFPCAFFELAGRTLLAYGTAWNRLDVSDPRTGELLTRRDLPIRENGQLEPEHYLDYFHAGLIVSPDNEWIAD